MLPSSQPGSARADDANAEEAAVDMDRGNAERYLTGNPAVMTTLPVVGKRTIRLQFPPVAPTLCPTARFSAFPAIRILVLTAIDNENGAGMSRSTTNLGGFSVKVSTGPAQKKKGRTKASLQTTVFLQG